jgi:peptidoglycan/xylan/chitin deacetylase (PgdA/CDA1 family)
VSGVSGVRHTTLSALVSGVAAAVVLAALVGLSGCGAPSHESAGTWHGASAASAAGGEGDPGPSGSPAPPAGALPVFSAPPQAVPIALPSGPRAAWLSRIATDQPVAFLTIDDGWIRTPEALTLMRQARIPVTLFLTVDAIRADPAYFVKLQGDGAVIEAHTITHKQMKGMAFDRQKQEVCGSADQLGTWYGRRPLLFRPPFGDKDDGVLRAVHECGLKAAFFWTETVNNGVVQYQKGRTVQRGDIILMHFRATFAADFTAALTAIHDAGLTPALLENYLP